MVKEVVKCPKCNQPTITMKRIPKLEETREISFDDYVKRELAYERKRDIEFTGFSSGLYLGPETSMQLVFTCATCGFTKVYDV